MWSKLAKHCRIYDAVNAAPWTMAVLVKITLNGLDVEYESDAIRDERSDIFMIVAQQQL